MEYNQMSSCKDGTSICYGNHSIQFFNEILVDLGTINNLSSKPDADGYTQFEIYNPVSKRKAYLKIRFKENQFDLKKDALRTDKEHMCHEPSIGLCETTMSKNGVNEVNCASTIRYFDGETMQTLNSEPNGSARSNACTSAHFNIELLSSGQKSVPDQDLQQIFQGCRCRVNSLKLGHLSRNIQANYQNNPVVKTAFTMAECNSIPTTFVNLGEGFFSECGL
jgi:hypothetical protein